MLRGLTQFFYPKTLKEAFQALSDSKVKTALIAGGTSETLRKSHDIEALVDISRINELIYVKQNSSSIKIGGATPIQDLYKSKLEGVAGDAIKTTAGRVASTLLRNGITAGGNIEGLQWWSDLPCLYMALDAKVTYKNSKKERNVTVLEDCASKNEILTEILVPTYGKGTGVTFDKMVKVQHDYSMCTVATRITMGYGKIKEARIVVGALTDKPTRLEEAEKLLVGQKPSEELFAEVAKKAAAKVNYRKDYRASKEYQKELCEIMIRRSLIESAKKAGK